MMIRLLMILWVISVPCVSLAQNGGQSENADILHDAEQYLNTVQSLKATFIQSAADGSISEGTLYLKRPGYMRWEYHPPVPVLMVTSGQVLRYYDKELDQISELPIQGTIAEVLAQKVMDFSDPRLVVLETTRENGVDRVALAMKGEESEGTLTFEFERSPYKLRTIIMRDAKGDDTIISLQNAEYNLALDEDLFELKEFSFIKRKGRRVPIR